MRRAYLSIHSAAAYALIGLGVSFLSACQTAPQAKVLPPCQPPLPLESDAQAILQLSGRISINAQALPGQAGPSLISPFVLQGNAEQGRIDLQSPTGSLLAILRWQPQGASIEQAGQAPLLYPDLPSMLQAALGKNSPSPAQLFAWLQGKTGQEEGPEEGQAGDWRVDNRQFASKGLISAERLSPLPRTTVRIKLDTAP